MFLYDIPIKLFQLASIAQDIVLSVEQLLGAHCSLPVRMKHRISMPLQDLTCLKQLLESIKRWRCGHRTELSL